jgi:hypothetical protein
MRKALATAVVIVVLAAFPAGALAAQPQNPSCWGHVTAAFAQSAPGAMGDHASSFDEPRAGIGNVAYANTGSHQPGALGSFLGGLVGIDCP